MKPIRFLSAVFLVCLLSSSAYPPALLRSPVSLRDSLPAGTRITLDIAIPSDPTSNKINYVVPAPPKPVIIDPLTVKLTDGLVVGSRGSNQLILRAWNGKVYLSEVLSGGQILVRGPNLLNEKGVVTAYKSRMSELSGGTTTYGGLTEPAGVVAPSGYVRRTFSDGAVYYEVGTAPTPPPVVTPPPTPTPDPGPDTKPPVKPGTLQRSRTRSKLSDLPWGYNRLQVVHAPNQDNWVYKSMTVAVQNAPGFPSETPDLLRAHGHTQFTTDWFYGQTSGPFGLPKKSDQLFYEVSGGAFDPYRSVYGALTADMTTIGENIDRRIGQWNTADANGLIDGVGTVKQVHFNIEYAWFHENGSGNIENYWQGFTPAMRQTRFVNYANDRKVESFQEAYNRGGVGAIDAALHQKWRNVVLLSNQIINRHSKPARAYMGDWFGLVNFYNLANWNQPYSASDLLTSDVNDSGRFSEANESANAGELLLHGHERYNVTGNLRKEAGIAHCYNYEWGVSMTAADYDEYSRLRGAHDIRQWQDKMRPNLYRPYDRAFHAQLTQVVKEKKGWNDLAVYWQTEPIYEQSIFVEGRGEEGAWVSWTLDAQPPFAPCKLPLHAEVCDDIVYNARMHLQGLLVWDSQRRQNMPAGQSEHSHPWLHQTGREGLQRAYDEINQYDAFGPDTRRYNGNIAILNAQTGQYVSGDASKLLLANGKQNGKPFKPVPLVTGVYRPSTGIELYSIYAVHQGRYDQTEVKFKSPVDGAELTATAVGWGPVLYVRQGSTN